MKKGNVQIDFLNDKVSFLDENIDRDFTSSGLYALPISETEQLLDKLDNYECDKVFLTVNHLLKSCDEKTKYQRNYTANLVIPVLEKKRKKITVCQYT